VKSVKCDKDAVGRFRSRRVAASSSTHQNSKQPMGTDAQLAAHDL